MSPLHFTVVVRKNETCGLPENVVDRTTPGSTENLGQILIWSQYKSIPSVSIL